MLLKKMLKKLNQEDRIIENLFSDVDSNARILDVGSGKGRNIKFLNELGFSNVLGVELNNELVELANSNNLRTVSVDSFTELDGKFDVILFSHVIEHFSHGDLLKFLESYFTYAKDPCDVIILTPLESKFFYHDFDHVKPYHPQGIETVFSNKLEQIQFSSQFVLDIEDIYFRKAPFRLSTFNRKAYLGKPSIFFILINALPAILWLVTGKLFGTVTGWGGRYKITKKSKTSF